MIRLFLYVMRFWRNITLGTYSNKDDAGRFVMHTQKNASIKNKKSPAHIFLFFNLPFCAKKYSKIFYIILTIYFKNKIINSITFCLRGNLYCSMGILIRTGREPVNNHNA